MEFGKLGIPIHSSRPVIYSYPRVLSMVHCLQIQFAA